MKSWVIRKPRFSFLKQIFKITLKLGLYAQNIDNDSFANNFSKFFDLTNESDQSYYTGGLGALRSKENVCGVCLGTLTGSNGCSSELRICPVSYMYIKYLNVLSD